jgi:hypothetical protein
MDIVELDVERGTATINAQVNWIVRHCYGDEELYCGDGISEYTMDTDATLIRTGDIWKVNHRMEDVVGQYTTDKDYCLANNVPVGSSSP